MPEAFPFGRPRLLAAADPVDSFDCGVEALNRFLQEHALQTQRGEGARTYVSLYEGLIAGYYTLACGSVEPKKAPPRLTKGLARHPVPVMLLARLAVDRRFQGRSLGGELLRNALLRTLAAADIAGLRAGRLRTPSGYCHPSSTAPLLHADDHHESAAQSRSCSSPNASAA